MPLTANFAVGCTYKYLNGEPGAPTFIYVAPEHAEIVCPSLCGWTGHDESFNFQSDYRSAPGAERMRVNTRPILALAVLDAVLDVRDGVDMADVLQRSLALSARFITEVEARCPDLSLTPA